MSEVTIKVNNKPYTVGCADGQEGRVTELAQQFDEYVEMVVHDVGAIGEVRLFLMAALLMCDEMADLKEQLSGLNSQNHRLGASALEAERRVVTAISDAAERVENLMTRV